MAGEPVDITAGAPVLGEPSGGQDRFIWPFRSMDERPFRIRREYRTEIITSRSGREQRRALRQTPRKRIEFTTSLAGANWRTFNRSMVRDQRRKLITYDRVRSVSLAADMPAGDECEVDEAADWLIAGQPVMLIDGAAMGHRTVASVADTTVTFTGSGSNAWPAGTRLHAALDGRLAGDIPTSVVVRSAVNVDVVFNVTPGSELGEPEGMAAATFNDREVFLTQPNHWTPVSILREQDQDVIDYGHGLTAHAYPVTFASRVWQGDFTRHGYDNAEEVRSLFDRMKGQRGEFYMPTFEDDLPLAATAGSGTTSLTVTGTDVAEIFAGSTMFKAIAVFLTGGTVLFNRVTDIAESGDNSVLTVATAWGQDIAPAAVTRVSWMPVWRLASDIIETEWGFDRYAQTRLAMRMLEDLTPEVDA